MSAEDSFECTDDYKLAASISIACCCHGTIFINLHDQNGKIFATATMSADGALAVSDRLANAVEYLIGEQGALANCVGCA